MEINVLGLGNTMFSDEGFGVEAVTLLEQTHSFPPYVNLIDGGTQGIYLLHHIEDADCVLIFDALIPVDYDVKVYKFLNEELPAFIHRKMSSHQIGLSELLSLAKLHDKMPRQIALVGIPPQELEMNVGLSETARELIPAAVEEGINIINKWISEA